MKYNRGFTVAEIVVVIAIVSILASVVIFNAVSGSKRSRDIDRQADLRTVQSAIELYKQRYGRYPARCANSQSWSGQLGTQYACADGSGQYIVGLAPEFMPSLPKDGRLPDTNSGYVYAVNAAGTVYKLAARRAVETEQVSYGHPLKSCDADNTSQTTNQSQFYLTAPLCNALITTGSKPNHCQENDSTFRTSYAVWGGKILSVFNSVHRGNKVFF
jgi:prepilin-type N-terminal cleavage/methylation domain-containing protein